MAVVVLEESLQQGVELLSLVTGQRSEESCLCGPDESIESDEGGLPIGCELKGVAEAIAIVG